MQRPYRIRLLDRVPDPLPHRTLACLVFGAQAGLPDDPRVVQVPAPCLHGSSVQLWESTSDVETGSAQGIDYVQSESLLFGSAVLDEEQLSAMADATEALYHRIDALLDARGFPALWRVWHFLADITAGDGDAERYRQFALGRFRAVSRVSGFEQRLPAATAVGLKTGGLRVFFLAGREEPQQVENPRQVSAFRYPRQYGPRSPSFSRAVLVPEGELIVSGTASVVGHETLHSGAPDRQWREVLRNLESLRDSAATGAQRHWQADYVTVYLRDAAMLPKLLPDILASFAPDTSLTVLQGDICRDDLDVEAEALYHLAPDPRS